jgi:hypothetical protein
MNSIWQVQPLSQNTATHWCCGALTLTIQRQGPDWLWMPTWSKQDDKNALFAQVTHEPVAPHLAPTGLSSSTKVGAGKEEGGSKNTWAPHWSRWAFHTEVDAFYVKPLFPDKPIVVKPRFSLTLPPREKIHFFVNIPLFFQIHLKNIKEGIDVALEKVPSVLLNKVWFGGFEEGELCYGLLTRAVRSLEDINIVPHRAVCRVGVFNETATPLLFEKMCLKTDHMGLYASYKSLCTNAVEMKINTDGQKALTYAPFPPEVFGPCELLTEAENPPISHLGTGGAMVEWLGKSFF